MSALFKIDESVCYDGEFHLIEKIHQDNNNDDNIVYSYTLKGMQENIHEEDIDKIEVYENIATIAKLTKENEELKKKVQDLEETIIHLEKVWG